MLEADHPSKRCCSGYPNRDSLLFAGMSSRHAMIDWMLNVMQRRTRFSRPRRSCAARCVSRSDWTDKVVVYEVNVE